MNSVVEAYSDIAISSITLVEIVYLIEKKRLHPSVYESLSDALNDAEHCFTEATVTSAIVEIMRTIPRDQVHDMPDRIIAATGNISKSRSSAVIAKSEALCLKQSGSNMIVRRGSQEQVLISTQTLMNTRRKLLRPVFERCMQKMHQNDTKVPKLTQNSTFGHGKRACIKGDRACAALTSAPGIPERDSQPLLLRFRWLRSQMSIQLHRDSPPGSRCLKCPRRPSPQ